MQFLHHIYVVKPGIARPAPASIFKAAGHIFLPVKIIRFIVVLPQRILRAREHGGDRLLRRKLHAGAEQRRTLFQSQRVHRNIAGVQVQHLPDRIGKACRIVCRKSCDQIHVDIVKPCMHRLLIRLDGLPRRVPAAHGLQNLIGHGLRIDGNARRAAVLDDAKLFRIQRVRSSAFDGKFQAAGQVKIPVDRVQQPRHLCARKRRRCAAAHVERADVEARIF